MCKKSAQAHIKMLSRKCVYKSYLFDISGAFNTFPDFFVQAFKIVVDSAIHLMR